MGKLQDAQLEAAIRAAQAGVNPSAPAPIEHILKNCELQLIKELDPTTNRWFVSLWMTRGDHRWILQMDSLNAETVGNSLVKAAKLSPAEALKEAGSNENGKA